MVANAEKEIKGFLIDARCNTWAGGADPMITSTGAKRLVFEGAIDLGGVKVPCIYIDEYHEGGSGLGGREIVIVNTVPTWVALRYATGEGTTESGQFLKNILKENASNLRLGNSSASRHDRGDHTYQAYPLDVIVTEQGFGNLAQREIVSDQTNTVTIDMRGGWIQNQT